MVSKDCRFDPGGGQSIINFLFYFLLRNVVEMHFCVLIHDINGGLAFIFVYLFVVHVFEKCCGGWSLLRLRSPTKRRRRQQT